MFSIQAIPPQLGGNKAWGRKLRIGFAISHQPVLRPHRWSDLLVLHVLAQPRESYHRSRLEQRPLQHVNRASFSSDDTVATPLPGSPYGGRPSKGGAASFVFRSSRADEPSSGWRDPERSHLEAFHRFALVMTGIGAISSLLCVRAFTADQLFHQVAQLQEVSRVTARELASEWNRAHLL